MQHPSISPITRITFLISIIRVNHPGAKRAAILISNQKKIKNKNKNKNKKK